MKVEADRLVEQIIKKYSSCRSYRDRGTLRCGTLTMEFSTIFVRAKHFAFEWKKISSGQRFEIRAENGRARILMNDEWSEERPLPYTLKIAAGASKGLTSFIGDLLGIMGRSTLLDLRPYSYESDSGTEGGFLVIHSNPEDTLRTEVLTVDPTDLSLRSRKSCLKDAIKEEIVRIVPQLERENPVLADSVKEALRAAHPLEPTITSIDDLAFND